MAVDSDCLYDKNCACLHCGTTFTSKRVRSGSQPFVKRDTDFCTYFKNQRLNPILYTVYVCPACGFAFTDQFDPVMPPLVKKQIREKLASKWTSKNYGIIRTMEEAMATYKLAIYSAGLKGEAHSVKAGLYLRLAWLHRFKGNAAEERRFLNVAVEEYERSYIHSDYIKADKEMSEARILYLIGELMRRVERYDQAIRYFAKVAELKDRTIETGIINMARDQWSLAREEYRLKQQQIV
jgi:uncharacterized protein (DUF2225 family)